ncbi:hypothetical protein F5Y09DRAFT_226226 [Xylaria sp. FL1042]|nr:hypothetical protein F5Y09DRAFT_226226 [Xylaria sp. FL1042]
MCRAWKYVYRCGHQRGNKWYEPEDPRDCPDAVRANRRDRRSQALLRCQPLSTASVSAEGVCHRSKCYAAVYLIPFGWWCHQCGHMNRAGAATCANRRAGFNQRPCRHEPCNQCEDHDPAGRA